MAHYISVTAIGYLSQEPSYATSPFGKEYARFIVGVCNPNNKGEKNSFTYLECTLWNKDMVTKCKSLGIHRGDELMIMGQFYQESYKGKLFNKVYVRDLAKMNNPRVDANVTPEIMQENPNETKEINEDTNVGNANVDVDDFIKNF